MPPLGTYNLHASLLPKLRGAAPINWAIIKGEKETGVTTFKLKHEIDTGDILMSERVPIGDSMTAGELHDELMSVGAGLVLETVRKIEISANEGRELVFRRQEENVSSHAPKLFKEDMRIRWDQPMDQIYNLIRGLSPYPAAYGMMDNGTGELQLVKIYAAEPEKLEHSNPNGMMIVKNKEHLKVYVPGGVLSITDLQLQGKKRMGAGEFLRGFRLSGTERFV